MVDTRAQTEWSRMKVKVRMETVQKLAAMLQSFDAETESFLDSIPTPDKYAILAMALAIGEGYDDYEEAHYDAMRRVSAQNLTNYLKDYKFLYCHLQDALKLGPNHFEVIWSDHESEEE